MENYLDLARQGKNEWWRYLLAVLLILFLWQLIGAIPSAFVIFWVALDGNPETNIAAAGFIGVDVLLTFVVFMFASVLFIVGIFLAVRFIHQRRFLTLITPERRFSFGRFAQGFIVWLLLVGLMAVAEALLYPGRYVWTLDLARFLPFVFLALIFVPIQTSAEELFFRGYLLQGLGQLRLRNIWILSLISGLLFGLPHLLNPEASANYLLMLVYYVSMGAVMAYVTLRDGRLELALGLHAANNLFSALFANTTVTVLPTPSLFTVMELDVVYSVPVALAGLLIFVLVFARSWKKKAESVQVTL